MTYKHLLPWYLYCAFMLVMLLVSVFLPAEHTKMESPELVGFFVSFLALLIAFGISLKSRPKPRKWPFIPNEIRPLLLFGFSMSAHTLNLTIPVFATYEPIFRGILIATHVALLVYPVRNALPGWGKAALRFTMGLGTVAWVYMTVFIAPVMMISVPLLLALGISSHAFVPLLMTIWFVRRSLNEPSPAYWTGVLLPALAIIGVEIQWYRIQQEVKAVHAQFTGPQASARQVPEWVALAERVPDGVLMRKVVLAETRSQMTDFAMPDRIIGSGARLEIQHDPLVVIACWIYGKTGIDEETALHLLEARYDARHDTHRRLWSDEGTFTDSVKTRVKVWPSHRLAYVEKTVTVAAKEAKQRNWWANNFDREAVYTFLMPDGAVATSLSLWVDGVEQPSRLTTRGKADSAYVQIVGRERRDPALLHWQEGNRVTITVFPVRADLPRRFKVGFTVPLAVEDGKVILRNIPFSGPDYSDAREDAEIRFADGKLPEDVRTPWRFLEYSDRITCASGYRPDWEVNFPVQPLHTGAFCFGETCVQASDLPKPYESFVPEQLILDVNAAWTPGEIQKIWEMAHQMNIPVGAFMPGLTPLTEANHTYQLARLHEHQYQLLPLYQLENPGKTLVITKGRTITPMLSDLKDTPFEAGMRAYLTGEKGQVRVFSLSPQPPAWLGALHHLRATGLATGDAQTLHNLLQHKIFPVLPENENAVALPASGVLLTRTAAASTTASAQTPDHVLRLFAYNDLLRDIGRRYYDRAALEATWLRKAEQAYVVSPVSSLIVLETQADYERTGIAENTQTLGNASGISGGGAVPEPHEWALIGVLVLALGWFGWKRR